MPDALQVIAELQRAALGAADPREAIFRRVQRVGHTLMAADRAIDLSQAGRIFLVAVGKAAAPMADALIDLLDDDLSAGIVVTRYGQAGDFQPPAKVQVIEASHPVPDENSIAAARAIERLLLDATGRDVLLCAISGGSSALVTLPVEGVVLSDVQAATQLLLRSGATINELNAVRKHLDRIKGGGLARMSRGADTIALILSDVVGDDVAVIASGPTAPDPATFADAWNAIERFDLGERLPPSVKAHLKAGLLGEAPETPKPGAAMFASVHNLIVGSNRLAVEAAEKRARALGFNSVILSTHMQGEAREVAKVTAAIAREIDACGRPVARPACVIWGGETTVTVRGDGRGGRNQELALAAVPGLDGLRETWLATLATDGVDGSTDAAGAIVSGRTAAQARASNLNVEGFLARNDSYGFFTALPASTGDAGLIVTGPTGTNVNDLTFLIMM